MNVTVESNTRASAADPAGGRLRVSGYWWIFIGALVLRGVYLWEGLRNNELLTYPVVDAKVYVEWSRDILAGQWLWQDAINYTPMIPAWIAGVTWLFGWNPPVHFGLFLVIAAGQSVLIGKTAELLWSRRVGLVTGWLAALYWPLIIFEASYFSEPFAIWNLTIGLYLLVRWARRGGSLAWVFWAGLHLTLSILARANAMLCLPILIGWVAWVAFRQPGSRKWLRGAVAALALISPIALLCAPIVWWNVKLTGKPMLRTQGAVSVFVGNYPENRGIAIPAGVRWDELMYWPIRADHITAPEQDAFWKAQVFHILRERTGEWLRLMPRKVMLLIGDFEVSQEIDVYVYRAASRLLSLPLWPGWGLIASLTLVAGVLMWRDRDLRRGLPLLLFAVAYFVSFSPVQVCGRYRLPTVIPMLPLAGFAVVVLFDAIRLRGRRRLTVTGSVLVGSALLIVPDWLGMRSQKIINHHFLVGLKRAGTGDDAGAAKAFAAGLDWNPADPDCPLYLGDLALERGEVDAAERYFGLGLENFPHGHQALLGLGQVALARQQTDRALELVDKALVIAPNNQAALNLATQVHTAREDWIAVAQSCRQLRSYPSHPASVSFAEGRAWLLAGNPLEALRVYDAAAGNPWFPVTDRARALFLAGAAAHQLKQSANAHNRWRLLASAPDAFFSALAKVLTGELSPEALSTQFPKELGVHSARYAQFTLATRAAIKGDSSLAQQQYERLIEQAGSRNKPAGSRDVVEVLALQALNP